MLAFTHDCVCTYTDERTEIKEGPIDLLTGQADKQAVVLKVEHVCYRTGVGRYKKLESPGLGGICVLQVCPGLLSK